MHVLVTGGTGTIGSPVVAELLDHGHTVLALARSDGSARALEKAGAEVLRGGVADLDVLRAGAARSDGVVHLAFGNDYSSAAAIAQAVDEDGVAVAALGEELLGSDRPIVVVSGTPWVAGRVATEADPLPTDGLVGGRARPRRRGPVPAGAGVGPAGTSWHAVADEGDTVRDIATVIGRRLGLPVESVPQDSLGPFGAIFVMDQPASSAHTRDALGWAPTHPGLLDDLENIQP